MAVAVALGVGSGGIAVGDGVAIGGSDVIVGRIVSVGRLVGLGLVGVGVGSTCLG